MKNLNLYALANDLNLGDPRSGTIRIPFGRWDFGEKQLGDGRTVYFEQELSRAGAEQIAAKVNTGVAAGEKGVPVYWGHPDVPELAHKYPDKRAKGWIKSATIGPDFLELRVEWLEDNATDGFGWFSPYWGGPAEHLANGRYLKTVNDLTSVALVNIPNIQEFRLANESQGGEQTQGKSFEMPQHLIDLARRFDERVHLANEVNFDESKHPRSDDGKFSSGGGGGGSGSKESGSEKSSDSQPEAKTRLRKMVKSEAVSVEAGGRPTKDDVVFEYQHKMYFVGKDKESVVQEFVDRGLVKRVRGYHTMFEGDDGRGLSRNAFILKERGAMSSLAKELAARFDAARKAK